MLLIRMSFRAVFASEVNSVESENLKFLFNFLSLSLKFKALQMVNYSRCFVIGKVTSIFPVNATNELLIKLTVADFS